MSTNSHITQAQIEQFIDNRINDLLDQEARDGISYPASVQVFEQSGEQGIYKVNVIRADNSEACYVYGATFDTLTKTWDSADEVEYEAEAEQAERDAEIEADYRCQQDAYARWATFNR
jgi:hypothetical protein